MAIVVDSKQTLASGKIDIGAFRTIPVTTDEQQTPKHYELEISYSWGEYDHNFQKSSFSIQPLDVKKSEVRQIMSQLLSLMGALKNLKRVENARRELHSRQNRIFDFDIANEECCGIKCSPPFLILTVDSKGKRGNESDRNETYEGQQERGMFAEDSSNNINYDKSSEDIAMKSVSVSEYSEQSRSQLGALENEYFACNHKLELLKMEEYQNFRFYRDTFTL